MRILSAALLLAFVPAAAGAADWRLATEASAAPGGRAIGFVDEDTIHGPPERVTFWAFLVYERERHGADQVILRFVADCTSYDFESTEVSSHRGRKGGSVGGVGPTERGRAAPNSAGLGLIEAACGARPFGSTRIDDPYGFVRRNARTIWAR